MRAPRALAAAAAAAAAVAGPGCGERCWTDEATIGALDRAGQVCSETGILLHLDLGGEDYDFVDISIGPLEDGRVEETRLFPGGDGTVGLALATAAGGKEVGVGVRGYRAAGAVAFGSTSVLVEPEFVCQAWITMELCRAHEGPFCLSGQLVYPDGGRLFYCEGGVTRVVPCADFECEPGGMLCAAPFTTPPLDCGPACGACPSNCVCDPGGPYCD